MFGRMKRQASTIFDIDELNAPDLEVASEALPVVDAKSGLTVDPTCNTTITISCIRQLYNAVGYVPENNKKNSIGITGYLVCRTKQFILSLWLIVPPY